MRTTTVLNYDGQIEEETKFSPVEPTREAFTGISEGMTVEDVVERVGLPTRTGTSGMISLDFDCIDGTTFRIYFFTDMKVMEVVDTATV